MCDSVTQPQAQQACQQYTKPSGAQAQLVSIEDEKENLFVAWVAQNQNSNLDNTCNEHGVWLALTEGDDKSKYKVDTYNERLYQIRQ